MNIDNLIEIIATRNILVVGDVMLDEYLWGTVQRLSPEASVPIVEMYDQTYVLGGAGNVAANLASLGSTVWFASVVGNDVSALKIADLFLQIPGVSTYLHSCPNRPTTTKTRIIARSQQILRIDREECNSIPTESETSIIAWVYEHRDKFHACILSDYAKGVLTDSLISSLISICRQIDIPIIVDPKGYRYFRYLGATIVTPNLKEANLAAGNEEGKLTFEQVAHLLQDDIGGGAILITRGELGMSLFTNGTAPVHIPTRARYIYDVTGAGDTVIAVLTLFLAAGAALETATKLANIAAGMVVGKIGTACVSLSELYEALRIEMIALDLDNFLK